MRAAEQIRFYETLSLMAYIAAAIFNRKIFYNTQSLPLRIFSKLLRMDISPHASTIWYGDLEKITGIRKNAYARALKKIQTFHVDLWDFGLRKKLAIDYHLIAEKFLLDFLFNRYEFIGLACQYADENPHCSVSLTINSLAVDTSVVTTPRLEVRQAMGFSGLQFFAGVLVAPFFAFHFVRKNRVARPTLQQAIICEVDCKKIYDMFRELLGTRANVQYFIQRHYVSAFDNEEFKSLGLQVHGLNDRGVARVYVLLRGFLLFAGKNCLRFANYGPLLFDYFKCLLQGSLLAPDAQRSTYLTFEHMSTTKAVRNELLRERGNNSVFVPYNAYAIDHFFSPEYRYNYDVLCSPSRLLENVYRLQGAATKVFLKTGAYSPHLKSPEDVAMKARIRRLQDFKGARKAVTILSCGIQDGLLSVERRLMLWAKRLAEDPEICVFVRMKPVAPPEKYANFYVEQLGNAPNILLTHKEYELFDFLHVSDLFVTSISSSAVDLCSAGGAFYSVDFWSDPDLYLWQTSIDGVFLDPDLALEAVQGWIKDAPGIRREHEARMASLAELIAYQFDSFEEYKQNLLTQLSPYLPSST
ncbi:hypothetical protein [Herbaspirillum sp. NPDC101397]|uniref:hypothetical protein n=1 Tax=Herbaspirillum sp. NPDC101397 TaxID=3364006 RepID=UPI00383A65FA